MGKGKLANARVLSKTIKHFPPTALLAVVRIQHFEPNSGTGGIGRELVFGKQCFQGLHGRLLGILNRLFASL